MPAAIALRYARVLADLAGPAPVDQIAAELGAFAGAMESSEDLRNALASPAVPPARKRAVVAQLAQMLPLSDLVKRFLFVLIDRRRSLLVRDIREAFEQVMDERLGIVRADVSSARELTESQRAMVVGSLTRLTGKQVRARFGTDSELIGGVVARIGSTVYDGSVKGQLGAIRHRLAGAER